MSQEPRIAPYGSWKSPITAAMGASASIRRGQIRIDGDIVHWVESRPSEAGRSVVMRETSGAPEQLTPAGFNVRTAVHEYGGAAFTVHEGVIYFSHFNDGRIYRQRPGESPEPVTPLGAYRYADLIMDEKRNRLICIMEDHTLSDLTPANSIVAIDLESGDVHELVAGADFYSSPALRPDGMCLAWLEWNLPDMPWDGTELWTGAFLEDGTIGNRELIAGGRNESIFQPRWSPDGVLHFVSDRTGWWNIYRRNNGADEPLWSTDAEFGEPQWAFGQSTYAFISPERIFCKFKRNGKGHVATLDTRTGQSREIELPYDSFGEIQVSAGKGILVAGSPTEPLGIIRLDLDHGTVEMIQASDTGGIDPGYISIPRPIEYPTEEGATAYAYFYPPVNRDFAAPEGERPPLMVISHGGPTGSTATTFDTKIQYWTSRGIAVLDVDYGGSTGYGRAYRERLNGNWGVVDVDDCINGALYLAERGEVDRDRLMIRGGSAGGYTTLAALTFRDVFKAGASYYGISDLEALEEESHKFESRYNNSLVGPYPAKQDIYRERSPIHFTERLSCPIILFQGLEDKVVPPNQAELMFEAVKAKGLPVAYLAFEGEQHGFRKAENIIRTLEAELYFYGKVFGFELADPVEPVAIENLNVLDNPVA